MRNSLVAVFVALATVLFVGSMSAEACTSSNCVPAKPVCKCVTISAADFNACGRAWYASTSEGWKSPMFRARKGCICTTRSNTWSYIGTATNRAYLWNIWVGH